jgi:hypothetical protein
MVMKRPPAARKRLAVFSILYSFLIENELHICRHADLQVVIGLGSVISHGEHGGFAPCDGLHVTGVNSASLAMRMVTLAV